MDAERIELMPAPVVSADWRIMLWIGAAVIFFTFGGLGGWSAVARIDSAVVADGICGPLTWQAFVSGMLSG